MLMLTFKLTFGIAETAFLLQDVLKRLDKSFDAFFLRLKKGVKAGFPRFKSQNRFDSFCYPQAGFSLTDNKLHLSKIGKVKIKFSRPVIGKAKTCTVKNESAKWFVIFQVETIAEPLPKTGRQIGIDVEIENFATLSDGTQVDNFKFYASSHKEFRRAQRSIARKKKDSNNQKKPLLNCVGFTIELKTDVLIFSTNFRLLLFEILTLLLLKS